MNLGFIIIQLSAITPEEIIKDAVLGIANNRIEYIGQNKNPLNGEVKFIKKIDLKGFYLVPGFIDLHVHGGNGFDFFDSDHYGFKNITEFYARHGITTLMATITTGCFKRMTSAIQNVAAFIDNKRVCKELILQEYILRALCNIKRKGT